MTLRERLGADLKDALRAHDDVRLRTIRGLTAAFQTAEIARRGGDNAGALGEADETALLQKQAKQRRESIAQFDAAGRDDLAAREREELAVLEGYLPAMLSDDEIRTVVAEIARAAGADGPAAMGKVMGPAMARLRGQADGARVQEIVKETLATAAAGGPA